MITATSTVKKSVGHPSARLKSVWHHQRATQVRLNKTHFGLDGLIRAGLSHPGWDNFI